MILEYLTQPNIQLGQHILQRLNQDPSPNQIIFVSAFASLQTIVRFKEPIIRLKNSGALVRFVLGIDMGGTSMEVLEELLTWNIEVWIVKNRIPGHTFHPKMFLFQSDDKAEIIVGSNNITEGGFFKNYEGSVKISYDLPTEYEMYSAACLQLNRFLSPENPVGNILTQQFFQQLVDRQEIMSEREIRRTYAPRHDRTTLTAGQEPLFGTEQIQPPPPLPADLLGRFIRQIRQRRATRRPRGTTDFPIERLPQTEAPENILQTTAFYMTLPKLQGDNIPGEARIPIEAIELIPEFWGWRDNYTQDISPRAGVNRIYWNWRPTWKIWSVQDPAHIIIQEVRMYMYENSSDFRFYARPLINAGADSGDLIRITRLYGETADYECQLARIGTTEYDTWIGYCSVPVRNSDRSFGYV